MKNKKILKVKKLRHYLIFLSLSISLLASLFVIQRIYSQVQRYLSEQVMTSTQVTFLQSTESLRRDLDSVATLFRTSQSNQTVLTSLEVLEGAQDPIRRYDAYNNLKNYLFVAKNEHQAIDDILIVTNKSQYSSGNNTANYQLNGVQIKKTSDTYNHLYNVESFSNVLKSDGSFSTGVNKLFNNEEKRLLFADNLYNSDGNFMGLIIYFLDSEKLVENLLTVENYQLRYDNQPIFTGEKIRNNQEEKAIDSQSQEYEANVSEYNIRLEYQLNEFEGVSLFSLIVILISSSIFVYLVASILANGIAKSVLQPIEDLLTWMSQQTSGDKEFRFNRKTHPSYFTFREKLLGYFLITILVPVFVTTTIYTVQTSKSVLDSVLTLKQSEHDSKAALINSEINKIKKILATYSVNLGMTQTGGSAISYLNPEGIFSRIDSISLYNDKNQLLLSTNPVQQTFINQKHLVHESGKSKFVYGMDDEINQIIVGIYAPIESNNRDKNDLLTINLRQDYFANVPTIEKVESEQIIIGEKTKWDLEQSLIHPLKNETAESPSLYNLSTPLSIEGWSYQSNLNIKNMKDDIYIILLRNAYLFFILIFILVLLSYALTRLVLSPFEKVIAESTHSKDLEFESNYLEELSGIDEIDLLKASFQENIKHLNAVTDERIAVQKQLLEESYSKKQIQLFSLQNQVNPHFLYNSLDNLLFLIEDEKNDSAVEMVNSLSQFFRFVTNQKENLISIEKEIEFTKHYLEIMNVRFENFQTEWEVSPDVRNNQIVKLTLQPLVENIIHHGVRYTDKKITITVKIKKIDDYVQVDLIDDAKGINKEKLEKLKNELTHSTYNESGIPNVRDRLELYYENYFSFDIDSKINEGTHIKIKIPTRKS